MAGWNGRECGAAQAWTARLWPDVAVRWVRPGELVAVGWMLRVWLGAPYLSRLPRLWFPRGGRFRRREESRSLCHRLSHLPGRHMVHGSWREPAGGDPVGALAAMPGLSPANAAATAASRPARDERAGRMLDPRAPPTKIVRHCGTGADG